MDKDTRKVLREAERQGFDVRISSSNHPMIYLNDTFVVKASGTPGDQRAIRNLVGALRRFGFVWPPKK